MHNPNCIVKTDRLHSEIRIFFKIKAGEKNNHRHMVDTPQILFVHPKGIRFTAHNDKGGQKNHFWMEAKYIAIWDNTWSAGFVFYINGHALSDKKPKIFDEA